LRGALVRGALDEISFCFLVCFCRSEPSKEILLSVMKRKKETRKSHVHMVNTVPHIELG
jgi:hypothetical protein